MGGIDGGGVLLSLLLRRSSAEVEAPAVEAPGELVRSVDRALVLRSDSISSFKKRVDAGDEDGGAGSRGVGVAGEDGGKVVAVVEVEVEVMERGHGKRGAAPASVRLVVVFLFLVFLVFVFVIIIETVVDVIDKVLVDVLVVVLVVGVLLEKREGFFFLMRRKGERHQANERARKGGKTKHR